MTKKISIILICIMLLTLLGGCAKEKILKIENVSVAQNTFDFVDVSSREKISYNKLFFEGKEIVDTQCTDGIATGVHFATEEGNIVRNGNSTTFNGGIVFTTAAKLKYKLEDGTLTLLGLAK